MGLYASVHFGTGVLPTQVIGRGLTHAQTYDLGGRAGTTEHVDILADGRILTDGKQVIGDGEFEIHVSNRDDYSYDVVCSHRAGRLIHIEVAEVYPPHPHDPSPSWWDRAWRRLRGKSGDT